jgi:hypothetical protein
MVARGLKVASGAFAGPLRDAHGPGSTTRRLKRARRSRLPALPVGYNKLCQLEDFEDEVVARYLSEIYVRDTPYSSAYAPGREHRKFWEVAQAARALVDFGGIHPDAEILGVAAGVEATMFWATNHVRRVFATDLYLDAGGWEREAPRTMLTSPDEHSPCAWNRRRLVVQHMNALELRYEDACFDGVFCSSSLEHFGGRAEVSQALAELYRVLKPGGVATLSTEYRLRGPGPGLPGTLLFDAEELRNLIIDALPWTLLSPLDLELSDRTRASAISLTDAFANKELFPHIVLEHDEIAFTSVHLALRKPPAQLR